MCDDALRVISFAYKNSNSLQENDLIFLGICGIQDPPRKEIVDMLKKYVINVVPVIFPPRVYELGKDTIQAPFDLIALTLCEL